VHDRCRRQPLMALTSLLTAISISMCQCTVLLLLLAVTEAAPPPCSLNGDPLPSDGTGGGGGCRCDAAWEGAECERLRLAPASPHAGLQAPGVFSSWGGSVLRGDDGDDAVAAADGGGSRRRHGSRTWHMYAAVMAHGCGLNAWRPNSQIGHATATDAAGPYTLRSIIKPHFAHSPDVVKGDGKWLIYHVGAGTNNTRPCPDPKASTCQWATNCSAGNHTFIDDYWHVDCMGGLVTLVWLVTLVSAGCTGPDHPWLSGLSFYGPASVLSAQSPEGPWTDTVIGACADVPGCEPKPTKLFPGNGNDLNPAPLLDAANGSIKMLWRSINYTKGSGQSYYATATAPHWDGPYRWSTRNIFPDFAWCHIEDGFLWRNHRGWHALFHSDCERTSGGAAGGHGYSVDGQNWHFHPKNAYDNNVSLVNGQTWTLTRRERPKLILSEDGSTITHLINGVSKEDDTCADHTFTFVQPVGDGARPSSYHPARETP
jgi:hypothetical protein